MLTQLKLNHYNLLQPLNHNSHLTKQNDTVSASHQSMRNLTRLNLNHRKPRPNSVFQIIKPVSLTWTMADTVDKTDTNPQPQATEDEKGTKPEKTLEPPTPPEKPEAGDCCGSGCVRCVWDIYYDELEAYNQELQEYNSKK